MKDPKDLSTMADLRAQIDALDDQLVGLLAARTRYVDRAIELKPGEAMPARVPARVTEVLERVRAQAAAAGLPEDLAMRLWGTMIEFFIAREEETLGKDGP